MSSNKVGRVLGKQIVPILIVLAMVCIEVFVFNMPYWKTRNATPVRAADVAVGRGLSPRIDGSFVVNNPKTAWREIASPDNQPIAYLYADHSKADDEFRFSPSYDFQWQPISWKMQTRKGTDVQWYAASDVKNYSLGHEWSRYFHIGNGMDEVRVEYQMKKGDVIPYNSFTINPRIPFHFSLIRLVLEVLVVLLLIVLRPGSSYYSHRFAIKDAKTVISVAVVFAAEVAAVTFAWYLAGGYSATTGIGKMDNGTFVNFSQYNDYADALLHGHSGLSFPVNQDLAAMANPYAAGTRFEVAMHSADPTPILFDVAFKSGRYYVYFGVLPAVLLFVPYKLITGHDLSTAAVILALAVLVVVASTMLVIQLARLLSSKRRPISLGGLLLVMSGFFIASDIVAVMQSELFYQIPQTLSLFLVLIALSCWIEAKIRGLSKVWLVIGSTCMALTLASRPQYILASVLALPLFLPEIVQMWKDGRSSRKKLGHEVAVWISVLLPFVIIFVPTLLFNRIRFGGLFDFGATYNLTGYDMNHSDLPWTQLFPLLFVYFFQPPNLSTLFPFVLPTSQPFPLWLPMLFSRGGLFTFIAPFLLVVFALPLWRNELKRLKIGMLSGLLAFLAFLIFVMDAHKVGYDVRYILDFSWALAILAALAVFVVDLQRKRPINDFLMPDIGSASVRLPQLSRSSRLIVGFVLLGVVLAWVNGFFGLFNVVPGSFDHDAWWEVYSWFLFV